MYPINSNVTAVDTDILFREISRSSFLHSDGSSGESTVEMSSMSAVGLFLRKA